MKSRIRQWLVAGEPRGLPQCVRLVGLMLVPVLGACNQNTAPSTVVRITPESEVVALQQTPNGAALRTSVTLTNTSSSPVVFDPCALSLERKADAIVALSDGPTYPWVTVWAPVCLALSAEAMARIPQTVAPNSSVTIPIDAAVGATAYQSLSFDGSPGTYRVHLVLETDIVGFSRQIPHDLSVSDSFSVVAQ